MKPVILKQYQPEYLQEIADLFFNTVHIINARDYSVTQLNAWATGRIDIAQWNTSLLEHYSLVAFINTEIVGFGDLRQDGYLDRLYVHHQHQRQGIATCLCDQLETYGKSLRIPVITTHASLTARAFFEQRGYEFLKALETEREGIVLQNDLLQKKLLSF